MLGTSLKSSQEFNFRCLFVTFSFPTDKIPFLPKRLPFPTGTVCFYPKLLLFIIVLFTLKRIKLFECTGLDLGEPVFTDKQLFIYWHVCFILIFLVCAVL
jgi:hypothetical protein